MPLFRFDLRRNEEPWSDAEEALDLPSADEARQQAMCMLAEMAKDHEGAISRGPDQGRATRASDSAHTCSDG
jgi:hypothetical protein